MKIMAHNIKQFKQTFVMWPQLQKVHYWKIAKSFICPPTISLESNNFFSFDRFSKLSI